MELTKEQQYILNLVKEGHKYIKINAYAGTGKTTTLQLITKDNPTKRFLYLAFNKSVQLEAQKKFGSNVDVKTTHSLAYYYTVIREGYQVRNKDYRLIELAELLNEKDYDVLGSVKGTLNNYFNSEVDEITEDIVYIKNNNIDTGYVLEKTKELYQLMDIKAIECTHSFYLKKFQLGLANKNISIKQYDIILLDEANDTNPVVFNIFKKYPAKQKILVGDTCIPRKTRVKTSTGWRTIGSIVKDFKNGKKIEVETYNHKKDTFEFKPILNADLTGIKEVYKVTTTNNTFSCTADHLIAIPNGEYRELRDLRAGDLILSNNECNCAITKIIKIEKTGKEEVFDLTVADNHNFLVSNTAQKDYGSGTLVHNCQSIYAFRGAVNAMDTEFPDEKRAYLTHTFRCAPQIAKKANYILKELKLEKKDFIGVGTGQVKDGKTAHITRTNGKLIKVFLELLENTNDITFVRSPYEIFGLTLNLINLITGKDLDDQYKFLSLYGTTSLKKLEQKAEDFEDIELMSSITILKYIPAPKIRDLYFKALNMYKSNKNASNVLTTAHTSKGLEWDNVVVYDDFKFLDNFRKVTGLANVEDFEDLAKILIDHISDVKKYTKRILFSKKELKAHEEINLMYVAITRARNNLIVLDPVFEAFLDKGLEGLASYCKNVSED